VAEAKAGIGSWLEFYNMERQHQSLGYRTPANLPGRPVDMWTIGVADRLRLPRFPSKLERRGNARLRPHPHRHGHQLNLILMK
jgi:Integrase core domain